MRVGYVVDEVRHLVSWLILRRLIPAYLQKNWARRLASPRLLGSGPAVDDQFGAGDKGRLV